jgi:formate-dependent nitrite reductase membrane component NrfD
VIEIRDAVLNQDPHLWGGLVAIYLFLGGLAAGLLVFTGWATLAGRRREFLPAVRLATLWVPPLLVLGLVALWLDLGSKWTPFWLYLTFKPLSPMSWGAWILLAVLITSSLATLPYLPAQPPRWAARTARTLAGLQRWVGPRVRALAWANAVLGTILGLYTGVLLGTMIARPALNSPVLAPLFLASGLSAAVALMVLLLPRGPWGRTFTRAEIALHVLKLVLIGLYVVGLATSTAAAQAAAAMLVRGEWAWAFWPLVVLAGIVVPLGVAIRETVTHRLPRAATVLSAALVLAGGAALRFVLVYAGQRGL